MSKKTSKIPGLIFATVLFASCSPRISGTWNVDRFETTKPGENGVALKNVGTIHFSNNGKGEKNIAYTALGVTHEDKNPFKWVWTEGKYITIDGKGSDFSKTWIIITNKKKYQKWKSTDGTNNIQVIELSK